MGDLLAALHVFATAAAFCLGVTGVDHLTAVEPPGIRRGAKVFAVAAFVLLIWGAIWL